MLATLPLLIALSLVPASPAGPEQTLVVTTASWGATTGQATLVEAGRRVFGPVDVWVGNGGLGWGRGLHPQRRLRGPRKREGDGRAPAGIFRLGPTWLSWLATRSWCVDDPTSKDYARIVTLPADTPLETRQTRWESAEWMAAYRVAIVVAHNPARVGRAGSCIFLHDGDDPTVGCTAFHPSHLDTLRGRLRPGARLAQLPIREYRRRARAWRLPAARIVLGDPPR